MKMIHEIGRAVFLTTEYRTVNAAFLTSNPEEQERRFFYALMLRSRGRKSLDLCGFQNAQKTRARKDTFSPQIRVLLRNKPLHTAFQPVVRQSRRRVRRAAARPCALPA